MTIQVKAIEQYFHVVLFIMLYKVVLTCKSVDETLVCDHSNDSYCAVILSGALRFPVFFRRNWRFFPVLTLATLGVERVRRERTLPVEIQRYRVKYATPASPGLSRSSR